jgi:hypothetical protein
MSEENLEVLITVDDPGEDAREEDLSNHFQDDETVPHQPGPPYSARRRQYQRTNVVVDN